MLRTQMRPRGNPQRRRSESRENDQFALFEAPCRGRSIVNLWEGRTTSYAIAEASVDRAHFATPYNQRPSMFYH